MSNIRAWEVRKGTRYQVVTADGTPYTFMLVCQILAGGITTGLALVALTWWFA